MTELENDIMIGLGVVATFLITIALGAVLLLSRMAPAIEHILEDNVASIAAGEGMLYLLGFEEPGESQRERFRAALRVAEQNITEEREEQVLEQIKTASILALQGDKKARQDAARAIRHLGLVNQAAMEEADAEAKQLGVAGAWAAVLLAVCGFGASILSIRRMRKRILAPLDELTQVLAARKRGDTHRRAASIESSIELRNALTQVNALLDQLDRLTLAEDASPPDFEPGLCRVLLAARGDAAAVLDDRGGVILANSKALQALLGEPEADARARLEELRAGRIPPGAEMIAIENLPYRLATWPAS